MMLKDKMLALMDDINHAVAERGELIEAIAIALLTRKNLFILGDPGQAKSYVINLFRARITGAVQFERLLSKQTDEDQIFGRIDLSSLIPGSVPASVLERDETYIKLRKALECARQNFEQHPETPGGLELLNDVASQVSGYRKALSELTSNEPEVMTTGKIPEAHICFLDEIFKCNDGVLNSLLTALNERKYTNEGKTYPIPTISFFSASNEIPNFSDPAEKILAALYDRLELKVVTENVESRTERLAVLKNKQAGCIGQIGATITLSELYAMQDEVRTITVPDAVNELVDDILCELRKKNIKISDRKYFGYYPIAQAKAWLSGRTEVTAADLSALRFYLWRLPEDRAVIGPILERMCNDPLKEKLSDIRAMAADALEDFNAAKDQSGSKALIKFRAEYLRLYQMFCGLQTKAQNDAERTGLADLLSDLEKNNKLAHEAMNFTYARLEELAALQ